MKKKKQVAQNIVNKPIKFLWHRGFKLNFYEIVKTCNWANYSNTPILFGFQEIQIPNIKSTI